MTFCTNLLHSIHFNSSRNTDITTTNSYMPCSRKWIWVHWFSWNSQLLHHIFYTKLHPDQLRNTESTGRDTYIPLSKIWLSMSCFLWNSSVLNNFLYTTSIPYFMKIWQTLQSLILGQRQTNRYGLPTVELSLYLTLSCRKTYIYIYIYIYIYVVPHHYPPDVAFYILFNKYKYRIF